MALPQAFTDKIRSTSWPRTRYPTTMPNTKRRLASGPFAETDAPPLAHGAGGPLRRPRDGRPWLQMAWL